ncbi:MAG: glycosyltransferase, partial [Gammaproteobacteria bacterium]
FGLPVLEAMQFGAPTLCSNLSSLPEVAGDGALLLAPADAPAWARAMLELSRSPSMRDELARRGMLRAAGFSWRESAEALLRLYREAAALPRRMQTCDVR